MSDRKQPVVIGKDEKGELVWGFIPMARWQMAMFPLKYYGDFMAFWMRKHFFDLTGHEMDNDASSMDLRDRPGSKRKYQKAERRNTGD